MLLVGETIEYANGAKVSTSFITSLEPQTRVRTAPALAQALKAQRLVKAALPKYAYPANVRNAALLLRISSVDFRILANECEFISKLDSQAANGKNIFGGGIIMSNAKAAELKAAELKAAELKAAELKAAVESTEWRLSPRELQIIEQLNKGMAHTESPNTSQLFA